MTSKILLFVFLLTSVSCQQDEDDGSYNPEKYEKPYEEYVDDGSLPEQVGFPNQIPAFQQTQPTQNVQSQQTSLFQRQQLPVQVQNPFPGNPFFQQLQNPTLLRQQQSSLLQQNSIPQDTPFQLGNIQSLERTSLRQLTPNGLPLRQPAPVNQYVGDDTPLTSTNYQTNDGHQRSEVVDDQGNIQGKYSYLDPNGKTITVNYSAGKDGFLVEGDHIPKASNPIDRPQNTNVIQLRPQQATFKNQLGRQFFNPSQSDSQIKPFNLLPQSATLQQFRQPARSQEQQVAFNNQDDGSYNLESSFQ